jgi:TorA maturation chaperone TorD
MRESRHDLVDDALARAVVYRTLSTAFQPPAPDRRPQPGPTHRLRVAAVALRHLDARASNRTGKALRRRPGPLRQAASALTRLDPTEPETVEATYWHLFGHTTRGLVCACETEYGPGNGFHQPQELADISGYYRAFGLRPAVRSEARPDHIASECEFMDFLNRKEALLLSHRAGVEGDEAVRVTRHAGRGFLRDHLGRFGRAFAVRVAAEDPGGFFGAMGGTLLAFLDAECARVGVPAGPVELDVRPASIDETPMACGTAEDLIQITRRR